MTDADSYFIRRIRIDGLFGKKDAVVFDFDSAINCVFGANGSGKTTVINLLVAALDGDISNVLATRFGCLTVYVSKTTNKRVTKFFSVKKYGSKPNVLDQVVYDFSNTLVAGKINRQASADEIKAVVREVLTVAYLPLHRFNASEYDDGTLDDDVYVRQLKMWRPDRTDRVGDAGFDPIRRMLFRLERKFKDEYSERQLAIREDLERLKDKVLEKLLIDDALVVRVSESTLKKKSITIDDYQQVKSKLEEIGLRLPSEKLKKHFDAMIKASTNVFEKRDQYTALRMTSNISAKKIQEVAAEYSVMLRIYRALDPIHSRLMSIISDVEKSTEYRISELRKFKDFAELMNGFLVNKKFEFSESGEFKIMCRGSRIKLEELSSGEKHILALLGKVAVSSNVGGVFIADEPELSLHLSWQRKLLPALRRISPSMQIIVATHAPAIIPADSVKIDLDELSYDSATV